VIPERRAGRKTSILFSSMKALKTQSLFLTPTRIGLAGVLKDWRAKTAYNADENWIFASQFVDGEQPCWPDSVRAKILQPAATRAGITDKVIGWHTFRRSFGTLLKGSGADVKVVQELMRHANSRETLDTYVQAISGAEKGSTRDGRKSSASVICSLMFPDLDVVRL
jgi:site-specific recombinase XerD